MFILTFLLKVNANYGNIITVKSVLQIRIIITGISGVKRLMLYYKKNLKLKRRRFYYF